MFRHHGNRRTFEHNLQIATLLSFVAGGVNVTGFISVKLFTTNVTGHFAVLVDDTLNLKVYNSLMALLYVFTFLAGAFTSNTLIEVVKKRKSNAIFTFPVALEIIFLVGIALTGSYFYEDNPNAVALGLLFAMGLQNALVTKISDAVVRTTHLTGLFTDLGIEVSQLLFYKSPEQKQFLKSTIRLRIRIIVFFFIGGIISGYLYTKIGFYALLIPAILLFAGLIYDNFKLRLLRWSKNKGA
jgi:uncharacterized membrane protein YoaK (UPF0700 family)